MAEEILPNLFRIKIPLPKSPLGWLNSWVVKGPDRSLIVDTGLKMDACKEAMLGGLDEIGVDLRHCDFFITHYHADHYALASLIAKPGAKVFLSAPDKGVIDDWRGWDKVFAVARANGFPEDELQKVAQSHAQFEYDESARQLQVTPVADGDVLKYGGYSFTATTTPGHTRGHTCLYEGSEKVFISGDHILGKITPNLSGISETDSLAKYIDSLDRVARMDVSLALPGHREVIHDCRGRIRELKLHHEHRNDEALRVMQDGPMTAYQIASRMSWDIVGGWEEFPIMQKWFATGEALAHLHYMHAVGRVTREEDTTGRLYYAQSKQSTCCA